MTTITLDDCIIEFDANIRNWWLYGAVNQGGKRLIYYATSWLNVVETAAAEIDMWDDQFVIVNQRWPLTSLQHRIPSNSYAHLERRLEAATEAGLDEEDRYDLEDLYVRDAGHAIATVDPAGVFDQPGRPGSGFAISIRDLPNAKLPGRNAYWLSKNIQLTRRDQLPAELRQYATITEGNA